LSGPSAKPDPFAQPRVRLDKWLWAARLFKTRVLAADLVASGALRLNSQPCRKSGHAVHIGDVLTFPQGRAIRVVRVTALGEMRGAFEQASQMYHDLVPSGDAALE
jgi:ribosome-associated heat shock protein Hsp15